MLIGERIDRVLQVVVLLGGVFTLGFLSFLVASNHPVDWAWYSLLGLLISIVASLALIIRGKRYEKLWQAACRMLRREWPDD